MREKNQFIVLASAVVCGLLLLPAPCDAQASSVGSPSRAGFERVVPDLAQARDHGIDHYMVQSRAHRTTITPVARSGERLGRIVVTDRPDEFGLRVEDVSRAVRDWSFRKLSDDRFLVRLQSRSATGQVESSVFHYDAAAAEMLAVDPDGRITMVPEPLACSDPDPRSTRAPKPAEALTAVGAALTDPNLRGYLPEELRGFTAGRDGAVFLASSCATCVTSCAVCLACAAAGCGGAVACAGCAAACVMCFNSCANCYRDYHDEK